MECRLTSNSPPPAILPLNPTNGQKEIRDSTIVSELADTPSTRMLSSDRSTHDMDIDSLEHRILNDNKVIRTASTPPFATHSPMMNDGQNEPSTHAEPPPAPPSIVLPSTESAEQATEDINVIESIVSSDTRAIGERSMQRVSEMHTNTHNIDSTSADSLSSDSTNGTLEKHVAEHLSELPNPSSINIFHISLGNKQ